MDGNDVLCNRLEVQTKLADTKFAGPASPEDLFSIFEGLDAELARFDHQLRHQDIEAAVGTAVGPQLVRKQSSSSVTGGLFHESETEMVMEATLAMPRSNKRPRLSGSTAAAVLLDDDNNVNINNYPQDGQQRVSHITVERNRRKQMNEHLAVLRSLMPSFYVKRVRLLTYTYCET